MGGIIVLIFGVVLLGVGAFMAWVGLSTARYARELQTYSAVVGDKWQAGAKGYLEGRLSEQTPTQIENLLLYQAAIYRGIRTKTERSVTSVDEFETIKEPIWADTERNIPTLILNVNQQSVPILGGTYSLSNFSTIYSPGDALVKDETVRYEGFVAGDEVVVIGEVIATDDGLAMKPTALWGGNFANYLDSNQSGSRFALIVGIGMVLLSGGLLFLGGQIV